MDSTLNWPGDASLEPSGVAYLTVANVPSLAAPSIVAGACESGIPFVFVQLARLKIGGPENVAWRSA